LIKAVDASAAMVTPISELAAKIRAAGPVIDPRGMAALYAPLQEREPYVGVAVTRHLSYGADAQNLADIFAPAYAREGDARPVLIFVHGGGFTAGERRLGSDSPFYDNVGVWAARHGFIGINMTYRRAPRARWPAGAEDVGAVAEWASRTMGAEGGDPRRIFLVGHSAGATHVAGYVSHADLSGESLVKGAIIVSGSFEVTPDEDVSPDEVLFAQHEKTYFGDDPSIYPKQSSTAGLLSTPIPLLFVNPEFDMGFFHRHAAELRSAFQRAERECRFVILPAENHMSQIFSINTQDEGLSGAIEQFIRGIPKWQ
jgi:acetyl esterase/lipase